MNGLRFIRTRCNLSLSELANKLGITRQALSSWENGYKEIPNQRKEQLVNFFGIDASSADFFILVSAYCINCKLLSTRRFACDLH